MADLKMKNLNEITKEELHKVIAREYERFRNSGDGDKGGWKTIYIGMEDEYCNKPMLFWTSEKKDGYVEFSDAYNGGPDIFLWNSDESEFYLSTVEKVVDFLWDIIENYYIYKNR